MDDLQLLLAWSEPLIRTAQVLLIVLLAWRQLANPR